MSDEVHVNRPGGQAQGYGPAMEFRVLGPVEVLDSGRRLDLGGPKQRTVLALLVANAGRTLSTDQLIEGAYGEDAPEAARRSVQTYVSNLRSEIGDMITAVRAGYEFQPADSSIDSQLFEAEVSAGQALLDDDPAAASERLTSALAMWSGHPFQDVETRDELDTEARRLSELRLVTLESRIDADLAVGSDRELVGELEALTIEFPFREAFQSQHMLALYRSDRQAEALRAYAGMRERLAEELGVDPSPALRQLEQRILQQDPDLRLAPTTSVRRRAVLVIDISPAALSSTNNPDERSRTLAEVDINIDRSVADGAGTIAAQEGTTTYATFERFRGAVEAAEAICRTTTAAADGAPIVRIGLDLGDIEEQADGHVAGPAVIRAAGLVAGAHPGQILLSMEAQVAIAADSAGGSVLKNLGTFRIARLEQSETVHQLMVDGMPTEFPDLLTDSNPPGLPSSHVGAPGYELRDELGRGLFGVVYRAYQPSIGREVAIKVIAAELANSPGFIRRFAIEAQMVSRIEHPNVVPLYDFWRGPDGALLVMRLMRGGNLTTLASERRLGRDLALRLVDQIGGALATAHDIGIAHGDITSSNVLLNESGEFFLGDFGIASDTSSVGGSLTQQLDVAAFGSMLADVAATDAFTEQELFLIQAARDGTHATAASWLKDWRELAGTTASTPTYTPTRNPYKGLAAFGELDTNDFHGRDAVTAELIDRVAASRLIAAVGPSGVGKSSVVRAGLLPALRRGNIAGSEQWLIADSLPGAHPFERLASSLIRVASSAPHDLDELLRTDPRGLIKAVERYLPANAELVVVIDQFEELFTLTRDKETQERFLDLLTTSVQDPSSTIRIIATIRADFFDRPLLHPAFGELLRAGTVPISAPTDAEMRQIVRQPAENLGVEFESGLVERIVADVKDETGALPLVEFTLTELFEHRDSDLLTLTAYEALGGVQASLGRRAEEVYEGLEAPDRDVARQLFMRLVTPGDDGRDTRNRTRQSELVRLGLGEEPVIRVLDRFGQHRLVMFDRDEVTRSSTVEVAHEALLREWPRLTGWIDGHREELMLRSRLAIAVGDWVESENSSAYLLSGGRLAQHEAWAETTDLSLSTTELELLQLSRSAEDNRAAGQRRRRQRIMTGFAAAAVIAAVLAVFAFSASRRADSKAAEAEASASLAASRELAASAINVLGTDPELSVLLTLEAIAATPAGQEQPVEVIDALSSAVQGDRLSRVIDTGFGDGAFVALSPDESVLYVANGAGLGFAGVPEALVVQAFSVADDTLLWDHQITMATEFRDDGVLDGDRRLHFLHASPDGTRLSVGISGTPSRFIILEAATGVEVYAGIREDCGGWLTPMGWSPDGSVFAVYANCSLTNENWLEVLDGTTFETLIDIAPLPSGDGFASFDDAGQLYVFSALADVAIYDSPDFTTVRTLPGVRGFGQPAPDGSVVVTFDSPPDICFVANGLNRGADCGVLGSFDTSTGQRIDSLTPLSAVPRPLTTAFGFSGPGHLYAVPTSNETVVWDLNTGEQIFSLPGGQGSNAVITADGREMFTAHVDGSVKVWDLVPTTGLRSLGDLGRYSAIAVDTIVYGDQLGAFVSVDPGTDEARVFFFDRTTGELVGAPIDGQQPMYALAEDRFVITAPFPGTPQPFSWFAYDPMTQDNVHLAGCEPDLETGVCSDGEPPPFFFWAPSEDGTELLRVNFAINEFALVDPADGSVVGELPAGEVFGVGGFNEAWIGGAGRQGILIIDRTTGEDLKYINNPCDQRNEISPDWAIMAFACDASVLVLDFETWDHWEFQMDLGRVQHIAIDTGSRRIALADEEGVHTFDYVSGEPFVSLPIPDVTNVAWLDDDHLFVGTRTGSWAQVSLLTEDLIASAKASVTRTFTENECSTYRIDICPTLEQIRSRS